MNRRICPHVKANIRSDNVTIVSYFTSGCRAIVRIRAVRISKHRRSNAVSNRSDTGGSSSRFIVTTELAEGTFVSPGYRQMLNDLRTGTVVADLILVDTLERLGRVAELPTIRKNLLERNGILVLTADSNFADPTTPQGMSLGHGEVMRATEDGRIKAHNVLRGKRDAAEQKHWPGGPPPFGYTLESVHEDGQAAAKRSILPPQAESEDAADHRTAVRNRRTNLVRYNPPGSRIE